jgi:hypothetical protein
MYTTWSIGLNKEVGGSPRRDPDLTFHSRQGNPNDKPYTSAVPEIFQHRYGSYYMFARFDRIPQRWAVSTLMQPAPNFSVESIGLLRWI